jgi:hypothetical protein
VIVWLDPPPDAPAAAIFEAQAVAIAHPGEHTLKLRAAGHAVTFREGVAVSREMVAALEDFDFMVGIEA